MVVVAVLAHGQHHHLVACGGQVGLIHVHAALCAVKGVLVGVALVLGIVRRLAQRLEEIVEHLLIREIVIVQDVAGIIGNTRKNAVCHLAIRLIDVHQGVIVKLQGLGIALQAAEHRAVGHVVPVDHRHRIAEIRLVVVRLNVQGTGLVGHAVQIAVEIIVVVVPRLALGGFGALCQIVPLADGALAGVGHLHEPEHVRVLLLVKAHTLRQHHRLRLHDDLVILGILLRLLLPAAAHHNGGGQRQHCQQQRRPPQKVLLGFLHYDSFPTALRLSYEPLRCPHRFAIYLRYDTIRRLRLQPLFTDLRRSAAHRTAVSAPVSSAGHTSPPAPAPDRRCPFSDSCAPPAAGSPPPWS